MGVGNRAAVRHSIEIRRGAHDVFAFVSDGANDPRWRKNIVTMDARGLPERGATWREFARYFRFIHTMTPLVITEFDPPRRLVAETPRTHPFWLRLVREVKPIHEKRSLLVCEIGFETAALQPITILRPPVELAEWWLKRRLRREVHQVRRILERREQRSAQAVEATADQS